jgi:hypothetical protein
MSTDALFQVLAQLQSFGLGPVQAVTLAGLLAGVLALLFFTWRARRGHLPALRPIAGYDTLAGLVGQALEAGQTLHLSLGTGGVGGPRTPESLAALAVLEHLTGHSGLGYVAPTVTVADGSLLLLAQGTLRRGYARYAPPEVAPPPRPPRGQGGWVQVRYLAADPVAYAVAAADVVGRENLAANVVVGAFGDEYLWLGEAGARRGVTQVAGTTDPRILPLVVATSDRPLIGEELFAAGAYLSHQVAHLGSLRAQDWARWLIAVGLVGAVVARTAGLF